MKGELKMMDLIRWNPLKEMISLRERMSQLFDEPLFCSEGRTEETEMGAWLPAVDMFEKEDNLVIKAELPGMDKKDFSIEVSGDQLLVRGEKRFERESTTGRWRVLQCAYGAFHRAVPLPVPVKGDQAPPPSVDIST